MWMIDSVQEEESTSTIDHEQFTTLEAMPSCFSSTLLEFRDSLVVLNPSLLKRVR
jgi:hypothetical protein